MDKTGQPLLRKLRSRRAAAWAVLLVSAVLLSAWALHRRARLGHWLRQQTKSVQTHRENWMDFQERVRKPIPTAAQQREGFIIFQRSVLERVYAQSKPREREVASSVTLQAARDEYEPAQLAVYPLRDAQRMQVTVSDLTDGGQHAIPAAEITVRMVRYYGAPLSITVNNRFGVVPKTLEIAVPIDLRRETVRPYWITVHVPENQPGGRYEGNITFAHSAGATTLPFTVDVIPVRLQEPEILYGTLCVNALANVWKPKYAATVLRRADLILRDQKEHGMNTISLRAGRVYWEQDGRPYLPDLEAAMDLYKKYRFSQPLVYCAGQLFKTDKINRSSNYTGYDAETEVPMARDVARHYTKAFHDAGLPGIVFIAVEEPNLRSGIAAADPPDIRQRIARELTQAIKESGGLTALTCTPESVHSAIEYLDYWIVAFKRFTPTLYDQANNAHAKLCIYANAAMMGQGTYFSRFLFGYFAWANGLRGVLPWTYPMQPKRFPRNVGKQGEGALNVKEGFLGLDGKPVPTIQWELSREGIDDAKYLVTIERLAKKVRETGLPAAVHAAEEADRFLSDIRATIGWDVRHYTFENTKTFEPTPVDDWSSKKFDDLHRRAGGILKLLASQVAERAPAEE